MPTTPRSDPPARIALRGMAERVGWDEDTALTVACDFIDRTPDRRRAFNQFLAERGAPDERTNDE